MTVDLVGLLEQMTQSTWFYILAILAMISGAVYYIRHGVHTIQNPEMRAPKSLFKNFLVGQPLQLLGVLLVVIAIAATVVWVLDIGLL